MLGVSIIVCSMRPELCKQMLVSIEKTIGIDHEAIVFDNREKGLGICQVYNYCASKANFPYLCFIHEDVIMVTSDWGLHMVEFAEKTPNCGIIGFAGGKIAKKNFTGWEWGAKGRYRYYDPDPTGDISFNTSIGDLSLKYNNPDNEEFSKVVVLDGLFLFCKRNIWEENIFDENKMGNFYLYDADFSLRVSQKNINYVCLIADIYHFSRGRCTKAYFEYVRIFQEKWKHTLPLSIDNHEILLFEELINARHLFVASIQNGFTYKQSIMHLIEINGLRFFLFFCSMVPIWLIGKLLKKIAKV